MRHVVDTMTMFTQQDTGHWLNEDKNRKNSYNHDFFCGGVTIMIMNRQSSKLIIMNRLDAASARGMPTEVIAS